MATAIVKNELRNFVDKEAEKNLRKWLRYNFQEIDDFKLAFSKREKYILRELNHVVNETSTLLTTLTNTFNKTDAIDLINKLNRLLPEFDRFEQELINNEKSTEKNLKRKCKELNEVAEDYVLELDPELVYQKFMELPGIRVNLPGFGPTLVTPSELETRFDILAFIRELIKNVNQVPMRERIYAHCYELVFKPLPEYKEQLRTLAVQAIDHLSVLGLQQSAAISKFTKNLKDVLQLEFEIEVGAPETSQDAILAEILDICEAQTDARKERLIELGEQLGYSPETLGKMSFKERCQLLQKYFTL